VNCWCNRPETRADQSFADRLSTNLLSSVSEIRISHVVLGLVAHKELLPVVKPRGENMKQLLLGCKSGELAKTPAATTP
jgi:hypothetical protein